MWQRLAVSNVISKHTQPAALRFQMKKKLPTRHFSPHKLNETKERSVKKMALIKSFVSKLVGKRPLEIVVDGRILKNNKV
jgi:hypothetical protein